MLTLSKMEEIISNMLNHGGLLTSVEIRRAINDGYKDVATKTGCIEETKSKYAYTDYRYSRQLVRKIHFVEWQPDANVTFMDEITVYCTSSIASGTYYMNAPEFSLTTGTYYSPIQWPITTTITSDIPVAHRSIYYTTDGTDPTNASTLYDEGTLTLPEFDSSDRYGTTKEIKAVVYAGGEYSGVTTLTYYRSYYGYVDGSYLYDDREYWAETTLQMTGGTIASGVYTEIVTTGEDVVETKDLEMLGGTIEDGTYTEIVTTGEDVVETKDFEMTGAIIEQGKWWNPIVEIEPPSS